MTDQIKTETTTVYEVDTDAAEKARLIKEREDRAIEKARKILRKRMAEFGDVLICPDTVRDFLRMELANYPYEVFGVIWLTNRHAVIAVDQLFSGTIDGTSVPPREIVRRALEHNAAAAILFHNHPSGVAEPSTSDQNITRRVTEALRLVDTRVLDHMVVALDEIVSMAERGLI